MRCPGQDTRYWKPGAIFEAACPQCGFLVEFFKDEAGRVCKNCDRQVLNPTIDLGCAATCQQAQKCLGTLLDDKK